MCIKTWPHRYLLVVARIGLMSEKGHRKTLSAEHYPLSIADMPSEPDLTTDEVFVSSSNVDTVEPSYKFQEKLKRVIS